ncbi:MAG TPA: hypothetical protein VMW52_05130, partial [Phycisphaerae bacterium]|nr:hypothetical protein [Phycisphaerae bacterium]
FLYREMWRLYGPWGEVVAEDAPVEQKELHRVVLYENMLYAEAEKRAKEEREARCGEPDDDLHELAAELLNFSDWGF